MFFLDNSVRAAGLAVHLMTNTALTGATTATAVSRWLRPDTARSIRGYLADLVKTATRLRLAPAMNPLQK